MHPKLAHLLDRYHADDVMLTVVRDPMTAWMLSRGDTFLTWDGWYADYLFGMDQFDDLLADDPADIEELWAANRSRFGALSMCWLFADGQLAPDGLGDRIGSSWGADGEDGPETVNRLRGAEPVAYLSLGSPDGLRWLASAVERVGR